MSDPNLTIDPIKRLCKDDLSQIPPSKGSQMQATTLEADMVPPSNQDFDSLTFIPNSISLISVRDDQKELGELEAFEFYEQSHFFIETLKDDLCQKDDGGWFTLKEPVEASDLAEPTSSLVGPEAEKPEQPLPFSVTKEQEQKPANPLKHNTGRWKSYEHAKFLEALRLYGKDWELIEKHVWMRDLPNIRAHAQKFLVRLVKLIEGEAPLENLSKDEAEFYFGILNERKHKSQKLKVQMEEKRQVIEDLKAKNSLFLVTKKKHKEEPAHPLGGVLPALEEWKEKQEKLSQVQTCKKSLGHSMKVKQLSFGQSNQVKFSFKSIFSLQDEKMEDILSQGSCNSESQAMLDFELPTNDRKDNIIKRVVQVLTSYKDQQDIPEDMNLSAIFLYLPEIEEWVEAAPPRNKDLCMEMFYRVSSLGFPESHPNFFNLFRQRISSFLEVGNYEELDLQETPCDPPGIFCPHSPANHLNSDLTVEVKYFLADQERPKNVKYLVEDFVFGCRFCRHLVKTGSSDGSFPMTDA